MSGVRLSVRPSTGTRRRSILFWGVARHVEAAEAIQRAAPDTAVVGTGYSWLQRFFIYAAEANIRDGRVSAVGVGRGALAYPDFALDARRDGELSRQKSCVAVSYCTALMRGNTTSWDNSRQGASRATRYTPKSTRRCWRPIRPRTANLTLSL